MDPPHVNKEDVRAMDQEVSCGLVDLPHVDKEDVPAMDQEVSCGLINKYPSIQVYHIIKVNTGI